MARLLLAVSVLVCGKTLLLADLAKPESIDEHATHQQSAIIKLEVGIESSEINAFCLNSDGHLVVACGSGPGQIRIANDDGKILQEWAIDVKPEALSVASDGTILVGGEGKLFRFESNGNMLQQADSPHAAALKNDSKKLREQAIARLTISHDSLQSQIEMYQRVIKDLQGKSEEGELNKQEEVMLTVLPDALEQFLKLAEAAPKDEAADEDKGPDEEAIQEQIKNLLRSKMKISSITSSNEHVFVATQAIEGYGYVVWKMDNEFSGGEVIVEDLRGCCGQMDVQCCQDRLFVAENSRHRVVSFNAGGLGKRVWGKKDRTGVDGFSSCCNPMNVCFNADGEVFTAESGTGRIKRFSPGGTFIAYVGDVDLVPGCKNVSIAVSPNNERVYMLDLTRNHIVLMKPCPAETEDTEGKDDASVRADDTDSENVVATPGE